MEIHRGSYRLVILVGPFAIKLPHVPMLLSPVGMLFTPMKWKHLNVVTSIIIKNYILGVLANLMEYLITLTLRPSFTAPIYVSFGDVSIQQRTLGEPPSEQELRERWGRMSDLARDELYQVNGHDVHCANFIRQPDGNIKMVDYGGTLMVGNLSLIDFLIRHHAEVEQVLRADTTLPSPA